MKFIFRAMQGAGFMIAVIGVAAYDSNILASIILMVAGGCLLYIFSRLESGYVFNESKKIGSATDQSYRTLRTH